MVQKHLPALLNAAITTTSHDAPEGVKSFRIAARATRALWRLRQAAAFSFFFVEAAGTTYGWKLVNDTLGLGAKELSPEPLVFGGGNKLIHNVLRGIGVVQGNGGILRPV